MKRSILFGFLLSFSLPIVCQTAEEEINAILKAKPIDCVKFIPKEKDDVIAFATVFNLAVFENPEKLKELNSKVILKIELVYTTYAEKIDFDQHALNKKRLKTLFALAPNTFKQPGIEWRLMAQSGCTSAEAGKDFFHGVVITFRDDGSKIKRAIELAFMKEVTEGTVPAHAYDAYVKNETKFYSLDSSGAVKVSKEPKTILPEFPGGERARIDYFAKKIKYPENGTAKESIPVNFIIDKEGKITKIGFPGGELSPYAKEVKRFLNAMPNWKPGKVDGKLTECMVTTTIDFMDRGSIVASPLEIYAANSAQFAEKEKAFDYMAVKASSASKTVSYALSKGNYTSAVIVCDITGSMAPYTAQMLEFIGASLESKDTNFVGIVLFNDGDSKTDKNKTTGKVGGIYSFVPKNREELGERIFDAMQKGNGGDLPENNIEAVLEAEKFFPQSKRIVMIADNFATPRDMELLPKVTKPIHVIVCGSAYELNEAYLDIAFRTKGSVFFNNQTIKDIHLFEEGGTVSVGKHNYVLTKGRFRQKRV